MNVSDPDLLSVIWLALLNGHGSIQLLSQHHSGELVCKGHLRQAHGQLGPFRDRGRETFWTPNDETESGITPAGSGAEPVG